MYQGRSVFAQLVELLPRKAFDNAVRRYRGQRKVRKLSCMDQLLCMIFAQLTGRSSLRETVLCLRALGPRRYHCGIRAAPARSTLADANENRDYRIFEDTALAMIAATQPTLPVDTDLLRLHARIYAIDSTTIDLCLTLFPWAKFRRNKAAVKAHTVLDVGTGVPVFVRISDGNTHDLWMLDQIVPQPGAFYVMDRGYVDFARLYRMHQAGAFFVTRAKRNMDYGVRERRTVERSGAVTSDWLVRLRGPKSRTLYPDTLRVIRFIDPLTGKRFRFLTNHLTLDAVTIALLYRKRWRIELFFKWIKQHLHIKAFFGTTPNAVKTQVWIAVIVYVLVVKVKHRYQLSQELNEIFQVLGVTLSEKVPVFELFSQSGAPYIEDTDRNQLTLFD
ncbi:MAG: IS4 family transposase [Phycisphaeraceae bacterium]